ncbi:MAG TPA: hypothetical protein VMU81_23815 [Acetobacteraceae bacterium]|nr:hypothetical protein [Acetobacteraceae bacterium]
MTFLVRYVVAVATLAACATANAAGAQPRLASAVTCVNPSSGATWQINIDYDRSTVDSNPATVSNDEISWRDAKDGWHYTLDRKSGALTVVVASSTGGYFLHDRCRLP